MITREILNSHPVRNLKAELSKVKKSFNYGSLKKNELVDLMLKNKELFKHIKMYEPPQRKKPEPKAKAGPKEKTKEKAKPVKKNTVEELKDFETASYFYKKCLDVSIRAKYVEGEAQAYMGLGKCEEQVLNKHFAMENLETALEKATDGNLARLEKEISKELVRVY